MQFGLSEDIITGIQAVFEGNPKVDKVFIFGSRAKGNYRPGSDIDLAIKGTETTEKDILNLHVKLSELDIPYKVDLLNYRTIKEPELKAHIDRVGIEFYSRWKEYTLGEITHKITDGAHLSPKDFPNGRIMFSVKDMTETGFDYSKPKTISQEDFDNLIKQGCQPDIDDVLIAKDGSVLKHIFRVTTKPNYVLLSSIAIIKPKKEFVNASFLVYTLKNPKITETILNNFVSGSGVPRIVLKDFKKVIVSLPPLSEQRVISSILNSLDDKIDLLQRQNKTLRQLTETLFRQWFVEEAEESWETKKISNVASINKNSIGKDYPFNEIEYLDTGSITSGKIESFQNYLLKDAPSRAQRLVKENDIVYSLVRPIQRHFGLLQGVKPNTVVSTGFCVIKCDKISPYFIYMLLTQDETVEYMEMVAEASTSAYPSLRPSDISNFEFQMPSNKKLTIFHEIAEGNYQKINYNNQQIRTLTQLRDIQLPKLMSGEVRVLEPSSLLY